MMRGFIRLTCRAPYAGRHRGPGSVAGVLVGRFLLYWYVIWTATQSNEKSRAVEVATSITRTRKVVLPSSLATRATLDPLAELAQLGQAAGR